MCFLAECSFSIRSRDYSEDRIVYNVQEGLAFYFYIIVSVASVYMSEQVTIVCVRGMLGSQRVGVARSDPGDIYRRTLTPEHMEAVYRI